MRRLTLAALLLLLPAAGWAQNGSFIRYHPPASATGSGDCDPAQFSSPGGDIVVGGIVGACTLDLDSSTVSHYASGTSTVPANGALGDTHLETDALLFSVYANTNTPITAVALPGASGAPTDDNVPVGTGTAWAKEAIPDCDDSAGQHLNRDTATNAWSCGTSGDGAGGAFDPLTTVQYVEEFNGGTATTGLRGTNGYIWSVVSTGTTDNWDAGTAAHPGWTQWITGATDNAGLQGRFGSSVGTGSSETGGLPAGVVDDNVWAIGILFKANRVDAQTFNFGLLDTAPFLSATYGIGVRLELDSGDTNWMFVTCNAAGAGGCAAAGDAANQKVIDSGVTAAINTWYYFHVRHTADDKIYMSINGGAESSFCAATCTDTTEGVPTAQDLGLRWYVINRAATSSSTVDLDMVHYEVTGLTRY